MTFSANFSLVLPEIVLAIAALVLLVAGAFRGKVGPIFTLAAAGSSDAETAALADSENRADVAPGDDRAVKFTPPAEGVTSRTSSSDRARRSSALGAAMPMTAPPGRVTSISSSTALPSASRIVT